MRESWSNLKMEDFKIMKQKALFTYFAIIAVMIAVGLIFFGGKEKVAAVNLTEGISPVRAADSRQLLVLESLKGKTPQEIKSILDKEWPTIGADLASWLRSSGRIGVDEKISSLEFFYGSGQGSGEDSKGNVHQGYFQDELIAKVIVEGHKEPLLVAVKCSNGLFMMTGELGLIYEDNLAFTIARGKGLVDYVSYETSINLARSFGLPIYKGKGKNRKLIFSEEALRVDTDWHQVTVLVFPGDEFDLRTMTYNGQEVID